MHKVIRIAWLLLCLLAQMAHADAPTLQWTLVRSIPRLPGHFTQGLVYADNQLFESTGRYGQSRLISYNTGTYEMQKQYFLRADVFGEGLTFLDQKLYQGSWKSREIFVYDAELNPLHTLHISGEGWGLTTDGHSLIMSNGSDTLQFLDPATGNILRTMTVTDDSGQHWQAINELEWIDGNILANVWHRNTVLVINGSNGHVTGQFNLEKLSMDISQQMPSRNEEQVLNGMAWNPEKQTLLVTGKDWPVWFELKITLH
jgi:glutaminyl-peptide cyclotransferase